MYVVNTAAEKTDYTNCLNTYVAAVVDFLRVGVILRGTCYSLNWGVLVTVDRIDGHGQVHQNHRNIENYRKMLENVQWCRLIITRLRMKEDRKLDCRLIDRVRFSLSKFQILSGGWGYTNGGSVMY